MKCSICGSELEPGAVLCKYCGNPVSDAEIREEKTETVNVDKVYCNKCGRVLDPFTHKCSSCEGSEKTVRYCTKCGRLIDPKTNTCLNCDPPRKYCIKCGRALDPVTGKCNFCDKKDGGEKHAEREFEEDEWVRGRYEGSRHEEPRIYQGHRKVIEETERHIPDKGVSRPMANKKGKNNKKGKKKNTALVVTLSVAGMVALFALTFLIFFNLLGGSFSEEATESPSPTVTATAVPSPSASPSPTAAPTKAPTQAPAKTQAPTPKPTAVPKTPEPAVTHVPPVTDGKYAYPSDSRIITRSELEGMTRQEIKIILNEIYARHGYTFNDDDLVEYFESKTWYTPTESDLDEVSRMLNDYEAENRDIIVEYQKEQGWRQ